MENLKKGDLCWMINTDMESINLGDYDFLVKQVKVRNYSAHTGTAEVIEPEDWDDYDPTICSELAIPLLSKDLLFPGKEEAWIGIIEYYTQKAEQSTSLYSEYVKTCIRIRRLKENHDMEGEIPQ